MTEIKKPWYMSKAIWAAVITGGLGILDAFGIQVPTGLYVILASFGLYGLRTAKKEII